MSQVPVRKRKGKNGKRLQVVSIVLLCCTLAYFTPPVQNTFKPIQYSESNGHRQFAYRYFGIIPYSKIVKVPGLDSNSAVEKQFANVGLELPPGFAIGDNGAVRHSIRLESPRIQTHTEPLTQKHFTRFINPELNHSQWIIIMQTTHFI